MRITNLMMSNSMLSNINRNTRTMHNIENKLSRGSMIGRPSDNPLMASRALRFSNTQAQISQHQRNVDQATSWTESTEQAFNDFNDIANRISELLLAVDGMEDLSDKKKIATELNSLVDELHSIMNKSFAGRFIFSGLRTDEPPFFNRDQPNLSFRDITQQFNREDKETTFAMDRTTTPPSMVEITRIRLAHNGDVESNPDFGPAPLDPNAAPYISSVRINGDTIPTVIRDADGNLDFGAMQANGGGLFHDYETGEILGFGGAFENEGFPLEVMYDQTGFARGDLNPKVFFTVTDADGNEFTMDNQMMEFEFGVNTRMPVNSLGKDVITAQMFADLRGFANDILNKNLMTEDEIRTELLAATPPLTGQALEDAIEARMSEERAVMESITNDRFNNLIGRVERYANSISVQHTDIGTRMGRLEMISGRLDDDSVVFEELAVNNHGVDAAEMVMRMSNAEVALMASMQIGLNNMQMSLLNFL